VLRREIPLIFEISVSYMARCLLVTSGTDLKAHYCPQEAFAILSRNKGARVFSREQPEGT